MATCIYRRVSRRFNLGSGVDVMIIHRKNRESAKGYLAGKVVKHKKISVTLPDKCFDMLSKQADMTGLSMAQVIRQFLPGGIE